MSEERNVHPDCRNASNRYHECTGYCFRVIAEAKLRKKQYQP
ncbi:pre-mRNA-splicing factor SYF2-like, partial [Trifolium medium]|nr:pre-mRNA-splicing factor SYF2-like [Trifolium medium]